MPRFHVNQVRSGEGWILTTADLAGPEDLGADLADLVTGPVLIASEEFESWTPPGGEQLEANLFAFEGQSAKAMLRDWKRWGGRRAIFACLPAMPDADARRRWMPDALRPWDPERLKATAYGQVGRDWAQQGLWFSTERARARFLELAIGRLLSREGVRVPNGDVTLVLEMPTDSTFDASFKVSGTGENFSLKRDFASRMLSREWTVRKGEWEAVEKRVTRASQQGFRARFLQAVATTAILVLSVPVFVMVVLVAVIAKVTGSTTSASASVKATSR